MKKMSARAVKNLCLPTIKTQQKLHYKTYITPRSKKEKKMFWYADYFVQSPDNMEKIIEMIHERERFRGLREYVQKIKDIQGQEDFRMRFLIDAPSDNDFYLSMLYINYHLAQGYYLGVDYSTSYQLHKNWESNLSHFKDKDLKKDETQGDVAVAKPASKEANSNEKRKNENEPSWYGISPTYLLADEHNYAKLLADEKLLNRFSVIYALSSRTQYSVCSTDIPDFDDDFGFGLGFIPQSTPAIPAERSLLSAGFKVIYIPESGDDELKLIFNKVSASMGLTLTKSLKFDILRSEHGQHLNTEYDVLSVSKLIKEHKILNKTLHTPITYADFVEVLDAQSEQRKKYAPATNKKGKRNKDNPWDELNKLIGCGQIKHEIRKMVDSMKLDKRRRMLGLPSSQMTKHSLFYGNPGCAKTTVGKIIAKIMQHEGLIKSDAFKLCVKSDIVGQYVGWTAAAVDGIFKEMSANGGGVLFLDEAYTYTQDQTVFDREAINCIVQGLEEHRDVMAIFAGYRDLMIQFTENNPGLKSRIGFVFEFSDYNADEMYHITKYQAKQLGYTLPDNCEEKLKEYYTKLKQLQGESFGNGREARKLVEGAVLELAARLSIKKKPSKAEVTALSMKDIETAIRNSLGREKDFEKKNARPIGFLRS